MTEDYLFVRSALSEVLRGREQDLGPFVQGLDPDLVLSTPAADLVEQAVDQFEVDCPTLRMDERYTPGAQDSRIDVTGDHLRATFGPGPHYVAGTEFSLRIPFDGDGQIFLLQPESWSLNPPRGEIRGQELILRVTMPADALDMEAMKRELDSALARITELLETARQQIASYNSRLRGRADGLLQQRRDKVLRDRQLEEFLAVPVGRRPDATPILAIDVPRRTEPKRASLSVGQPFAPEPAITRDDYGSIVEAIASFGLAAERFPQTFSPMPEPVLREILLVILNNQFGPAVGEMFSRQGKTDIAIMHDRGPVFIAECKIWSGSEDFKKAIEQLLSYLVWRDTKAALVLFVKNKNVTAVVEKATEVLTGHERFKRAGDPAAGHQVSILHHLDDGAREIEVALVVVPVPSA